MRVTVGADPELFLKKGSRYHSAFSIIPGTKEEPYPVENGAVQVDGMALEFNIDPAETDKDFVHNISSVMKQLRAMVPEEYEFAIKSAVTFRADHIKKQPKKALELGCDPDFNAYNGRLNRSPVVNNGFRTAAGHVHIGWTKNQDVTNFRHVHACKALVKALDTTLAVPSRVLDPHEGTRRRRLYGRAGAFRPKKYGVEYRVLGNFWILKPEWTNWIFDTTVKTLRALTQFYEFPTWRNYINTDYDPRYYQPRLRDLEKVYNDIEAVLPDDVKNRWTNA